MRNAILRAAKLHDVLIFVDDDQVTFPGWLGEFLKMRDRYPEALVSGEVRYQLPIGADGYVRAWYLRKLSTRNEQPLKSTGTGNLLIPMSVLGKLGNAEFDIRFGTMGGEDTDFVYRLTMAGVEIIYAKHAYVHETVPATRATRRAVRQRIIRQGMIRARLGMKFHGRPAVLAGGVARIIVGGVEYLWHMLRTFNPSPLVEGRLLTGVGYVVGGLGVSSDAYGGKR